MMNFKKKIQVNCFNRSKVIKLFVFQLWRHTGTPRKCTGLCSLSDKEGILRRKGHGDVKLTWYIHCGTTKWFSKISKVFIVFVMSQGVKMGKRFQNDPKHPILTTVWHRGVKLAWWVHVGMANSLVALNLEIWEILMSKGKKGVKRDPKLQIKIPYLH